MGVTTTSIRLDTKLGDEAAKILGRSHAPKPFVRRKEIVALKRFKKLMKKQGASSCSLDMASDVYLWSCHRKVPSSSGSHETVNERR